MFEQGLLIFRETVAQHPEIRPRLQRLLLAAVRDHRNGGTMDASLIRSVLSMLVELGIGSTACYAEEFEGPMLAETARFYHDESRDVLGKHTAYEYCRYAERRLAEERQRADLIMHPSSGGKLMSLLEAKLVAEHAIALVEMEGSGLLYQLEHERYEDVQVRTDTQRCRHAEARGKAGQGRGRRGRADAPSRCRADAWTGAGDVQRLFVAMRGGSAPWLAHTHSVLAAFLRAG